MDKKFKSIYLVCIDHHNDTNYVLARNPSLRKAREAAQQAKEDFPDKDIYITMEKVLKQNEDNKLGKLYYSANPGSNKCLCGRRKGGCVSDLSCRCSAISLCKQMDAEEDPYLAISNSQDDDLEEVEINVIRVSRNLVEVLIPDWADNSIGLSAGDFPRDVLKQLEPGVVLTAMINIDAESEDDLVLKNIQLAYEDEVEDAAPSYTVSNPYELEDDDDEDYDELEDDDDEDNYEIEDSGSYLYSIGEQNSHPELNADDDKEDDDISEE